MAATVALALTLTACRTGEAATTELVVFAAASLTEPLTRAAAAYEGEPGGASIVFAFDSSAALRTQIEEGAPADLFLSADTTSPERLVDAGLADGPARVFAANRLVIIVPADGAGLVETPADLGRDGVAIVAAGEEVPITGYADLVVGRLAALPGYPDDLADRYSANVVSREDNVKAVVAKVELGEADAAIVYRTDALGSEAVRAIELPAEANVVAAYAAVVVGSSKARAEARRFLDWLVGPPGQALLRDAGFLAPP